VLQNALDVLQQLHQAGEQIQIAVNIASKDLMQPEFVEYVVEQLTSRQLPPALLVLECREDALLQDPTQALAMLNRFSELGVTLALDDFGTGYTSLGMLREMPIDQVKVDCQFISDIHRSDAQAAVTGAIIDMAKNMQWQVVAEGVEEQAAAETLARMGCQRGQGYYFSRPFALKGFLPWLRQYQHHQQVNSSQASSFGPQ
jgi:EAL domain-containing protein (putative c-di-GMP-specific phosphodiesterase class I)